MTKHTLLERAPFRVDLVSAHHPPTCLGVGVSGAPCRDPRMVSSPVPWALAHICYSDGHQEDRGFPAVSLMHAERNAGGTQAIFWLKEDGCFFSGFEKYIPAS